MTTPDGPITETCLQCGRETGADAVRTDEGVFCPPCYEALLGHVQNVVADQSREIPWANAAVGGLLGGAAGAVLRFYLSETIPSDSFPWATLSVNLLGSFLLGIVAAAGLVQVLGEAQTLLLGVGFLGAFTTMSTFSVETIAMMEEGRWQSAGIYVMVSALAGPLLAFIGWKGGHAWLG